LSDDAAFFVPRAWIEKELEKWLTPNSRHPVAVLIGPPGTGKSRYANSISRRLSSDSSEYVLGASILRDLRANRSDDFSWPALRDQLLKIAGDTLNHSSAANSVVRQKIREVAGGSIVGSMNVFGAANSVWELRQFVLPALQQLPPGPPIVIIIDGLDEAYRLEAGDFIKALQVLAEAVMQPAQDDRGLGRLRLLLTSQPELPVSFSPVLPPLVIDMGRPAASDRVSLESHAAALMDALDAVDRQRIASLIAEQADGVWIIGFYCAHVINDDVRNGQPVPEKISIPRDLTAVYLDAVQRMEMRNEEIWKSVRLLLIYVAACQGVGSFLPIDVATEALNLDEGDLERILSVSTSLVKRDIGSLRFFHGDFGRWIIDGALGSFAMLDAHDRLAHVLFPSNEEPWSTASLYALENVSAHALHAAEYSLGSLRFNRLRERFLSMLADRDRLAVDPHPARWFQEINRFGQLCTAATLLPGTQQPIIGLYERFREEFEYIVGLAVSAFMAQEQIDDVLSRGDAEALAILEKYVPRRAALVEEQARILLDRILQDSVHLGDARKGADELSDYLITEWQRTDASNLLDEAVAVSRQAVDATGEDDPRRTGRLMGLANALIKRVDAAGEEEGGQPPPAEPR
jgi:hypothetical protein